jgi:hypothetical protein
MLKTISGYSPWTDLSNNITFNQFESHATVLLNTLSLKIVDPKMKIHIYIYTYIIYIYTNVTYSNNYSNSLIFADR